MNNMVERFQTSLVIVTHNLGVVARYATRLYVMYPGLIVESGTSEAIFSTPCHPYTINLLDCIPRLDETKGRKLVPIFGTPPDLINMPPTCAFLPRCNYKIKKCEQEPWPELRSVGSEHFISCYTDVGKKNTIISPTNDTIVEIKNLKMYFPVTRGVLKVRLLISKQSMVSA